LRTGESGPGGNFLFNYFLWIWSSIPKYQLLGVHGLHLFADGLQNVEHMASGTLEFSCLTEASPASALPRSNMAECGWRVGLTVSL